MFNVILLSTTLAVGQLGGLPDEVGRPADPPPTRQIFPRLSGQAFRPLFGRGPAETPATVTPPGPLPAAPPRPSVGGIGGPASVSLGAPRAAAEAGGKAAAAPAAAEAGGKPAAPEGNTATTARARPKLVRPASLSAPAAKVGPLTIPGPGVIPTLLQAEQGKNPTGVRQVAQQQSGDLPPPTPAPVGPAEAAEARTFPLPLAEIPRAEENLVPTGEETAIDNWALMRLLQGSWLGLAMYENRLQLYGWVAGSYTASSAAANNTPVVWNYKANEFLLQQAWVRFERGVDPDAPTPTVGFRSDWLFGTDYIFTLQRNLFNDQLTSGVGGGPNRYGVDPIAFYGEFFFPGVFQGLDVKVGRWFTPFGVESLEAVSSPTVSKSYAFNWAPPFTHTGIYNVLTINDQWTASGGIALGNDIWFGDQTDPRFIGTLVWTQPSGVNSVALGTSIGRGSFMNDILDPEGNVVVASQNHINVFDLVWNRVLTERMNYTFECIYGYQNGYTNEDLGLVNKTVHWGSLVNYLFYDFTDNVSGVVRVETFDDFQGARTGYEGLYLAGTLGSTIRLAHGFYVRPELRGDYNFESRPFEGQHYLLTAAAEFIIRW